MILHGQTDIGLIRKENQDTFAVAEDAALPIAVVCDGMGGVHGGSIASTLAAETFTASMREELRPEMSAAEVREALLRATQSANEAIFAKGAGDAALVGMGTTLVAAVFTDYAVVIGNVGDSRAYIIGNGTISQVSRDHSVVENLVANGTITKEEMRTHPSRNIITRALGPEETVDCDCYEVPFPDGDMLLLCSDGLVITLTDAEILAEVEQGGSLEEIASRLIARARENGAPDNVTVALAKRQ